MTEDMLLLLLELLDGDAIGHVVYERLYGVSQTYPVVRLDILRDRILAKLEALKLLREESHVRPDDDPTAE